MLDPVHMIMRIEKISSAISRLVHVADVVVALTADCCCEMMTL